MTPCSIADPTVCLGTVDTIEVEVDDPNGCVLCRRRRRRGAWTVTRAANHRRATLTTSTTQPTRRNP